MNSNTAETVTVGIVVSAILVLVIFGLSQAKSCEVGRLDRDVQQKKIRAEYMKDCVKSHSPAECTVAWGQDND